MRDEHGLTQKERLFADLYILNPQMSGAEVVRQAGYKVTTNDSAHSRSTQILAIPAVKAYIEKRRAKLAAKTEITQEKVLAELAKLAFANQLDYMTVQDDGLAHVDLSKMTRDQAAAIQELTVDEYVEGKGEDAREVRKVKLKLADKRAALVDVGKTLGMFTEKSGVNATQVNVTINVGKDVFDTSDTIDVEPVGANERT